MRSAVVLLALLVGVAACGDEEPEADPTTTTSTAPEERPRFPGAAPSIAVSGDRVLWSDNSLPARFGYRDVSSDEARTLPPLPEELFQPSIVASTDGFVVVGTRCGSARVDEEVDCDPGGVTVLGLDRSDHWRVVAAAVPRLDGQPYVRIAGTLGDAVVFWARDEGSGDPRLFTVDVGRDEVTELPAPPLPTSPDAADTTFGSCATGRSVVVGRYEIADEAAGGPSRPRNPLAASVYSSDDGTWSDPAAPDGTWTWDDVGFGKFACTGTGLIALSQGPKASVTGLFTDRWRTSPQAPKVTDWVTALDEAATTTASVWLDRAVMRLDLATLAWTKVRDEAGIVAAAARVGDDVVELQFTSDSASEVRFVKAAAP